MVQWLSFPFLSEYQYFYVCMYACVYIRRHLKKGSTKTGWVLSLSRNIHGELFRLAGMDYVAPQFFICGLNLTVKMFSLSKSCEPQAVMLPMPAEEAVPERGQQLLRWVTVPYIGHAPAPGETEEEGSAPTQTKVCYIWMYDILYNRF